MTSVEDRILIEDTIYRYASASTRATRTPWGTSCIPSCGRSTATPSPPRAPTR